MSRSRVRRLAVAAGVALMLGACAGEAEDPADVAGSTPTATSTEEPSEPASSEEAASPSESASPAETAGPTGDEGTAADGGPCDREPMEVTVEAVDFEFPDPDRDGLCVGDTVVLDNAGAANHTLTAQDDSFDTGSVGGGDTGTTTISGEPGTIDYRCTIHPDSMTGTFEVVG